MPDDAPVLLALPRATARALHRVVLKLQGELAPEVETITERDLDLVERQLRAALQAAADA